MLASEATPRYPETDPVDYPSGDDMGESGLQLYIRYTLVGLLEFYFEQLRRRMLVGSDQYICWKQGDPSAALAPDVYLIPDEETPITEVDTWRLWERGGKGPCLAIEVVADDPKRAVKDYEPRMLEGYEALGVRELFRHDPHHGPGRRLAGQRRRLLTHWVRDAEGRLREQALSHPRRARSVQFDFWLVHVQERGLRLGTGPEGLSLWPTRAEAEAQRAEAEARHAEAEARHAEAEAQRAETEARRAEAAEAEVEALRAELERLRAGR